MGHCFTLHAAPRGCEQLASSVESVNTPRVQVLGAKRVLESLPPFPLPFQRFSFLLDLCIANG